MFDDKLTPDPVMLPRGRRACRRKAEELNYVRSLHREFGAFSRSLEEDSTAELRPQPGQRKLFDVKDLHEQMAWLREQSGDNHKALLKSLKKLDEAGPWRDVAKAPAPELLDSLHVDFPNFSEVTTLLQQRLTLCRIASDQHLQLPSLLLNGNPGSGKTAYCQRVSAKLGVRFEKVDLSAANAAFTMTGLESGYSSGHPGRIWHSLQQGSLSGLWLLDELDKAGESRDGGSQYLLSLLEPVSATRFTDNFTQLPINAAHLCYVATSNDLERISSPLKSRFEIFEIHAPTEEQMGAVVRSIYCDIRQNEPWAAYFSDVLDEGVIDELRRASPRQVRRRLINGFAKAAVDGRLTLTPTDVVAGHEQTTKPYRSIGFL